MIFLADQFDACLLDLAICVKQVVAAAVHQFIDHQFASKPADRIERHLALALNNEPKAVVSHCSSARVQTVDALFVIRAYPEAASETPLSFEQHR
jgi:hypothetical protein